MIFENDLIFWLIKTVIITAGTLGMMSSLTVFRYKARTVILLFSLYMLWVILSSSVILYFFGFKGIMRAFLITISSPAIVLAYCMDQNSHTQSVFNYATQIAFSLVLSMAVFLLNTTIHGGKATDLSLRMIMYLTVIFLEWRFLRSPFRRLACVIKTGWGALSLIPAFYCILLTLVGTVPVHYIQSPVNILYTLAVAFTMLVVYIVVFQSLMRQYQLQILARDKDLLEAQIFAMNSQADAIYASEKKLHILKHDIRHFSSVIAATLQTGSLEQAEAAFETFAAAVSSADTKSYCSNYVINSILTFYFEKAEKMGVQTKVNFTPPPTDKIDSSAFAVMLSNALENAVNACNQLDLIQEISLKSRIFNEQYLMELKNTCSQAVAFGSDGLPISEKGAGHGIGTRSILAFAKEHNASVDFWIKENYFIFQMRASIE